jgi:serine-type D-Ala-D-Ala carboxypeptidase/endopeptidase (penicillin-binding protein 4)
MRVAYRSVRRRLGAAQHSHYRTYDLPSAPRPIVRRDGGGNHERPDWLSCCLQWQPERLVALLLAGGVVGVVQAQEPLNPAPRSLPEPFIAALRAANVPLSAVGMVIQPLGPGAGEAGPPSMSLNEAMPMNPASTMKLLTTYAALNLLGPAYTWKTEAFAAGALRRDVLDGDLALRGSGDPKLVIEHLWLLAQRIRSHGIREIRGDILLDKAAFVVAPTDPAAFDGEGLRPYNAGPDALLLNYKSVTFGFVPDTETKSARVIVTPALAGLKAPKLVRGLDGPCGDWRARLQGDFADPMTPQFRGGFPLACGERVWHVSVLDHTQYFGAVFRALWEGTGGKWTGTVREAPVPLEARRIAVHESDPLALLIRDINKFSNNVMSRQLFLTLGGEAAQSPGTIENADRAIRNWLANRGMDIPELVIENGAGLSRVERISPASLTRLLAHAFASPLMPEFISSLPLVGVDGTMKRRAGAAGNAHIKSGLLTDVRAIAGYVHALSGRRYAVVCIINHPSAGAGQPAIDALLDWVFRHG